MRWRGRKGSSQIEDRRGSRAPRLGRGGGALRLLPLAIRFLGIKGTLVVAVLLIAWVVFTGNTGLLLGDIDSGQANQPVQQTAAEQELVEFVSVVLADTETTWHALFEAEGQSYREPQLVLFRQSVQTGCGIGSARSGPFYCPADQKAYLDLSFFTELDQRFGAPGDFAQAYVIAHEIGHHVQTLMGISAQVHQARKKLSKREGNQLSVRQELQADCFAGLWAHHADKSRQLLELGDIEEGLAAASAIGDDRLQQQAQGHVTPDSFTHGSSKQRMKWFRRGLAEGRISACDTFSVADV